jgi:hypothetical protein
MAVDCARCKLAEMSFPRDGCAGMLFRLWPMVAIVGWASVSLLALVYSANDLPWPTLAWQVLRFNDRISGPWMALAVVLWPLVVVGTQAALTILANLPSRLVKVGFGGLELELSTSADTQAELAEAAGEAFVASVRHYELPLQEGVVQAKPPDDEAYQAFEPSFDALVASTEAGEKLYDSLCRLEEGWSGEHMHHLQRTVKGLLRVDSGRMVGNAGKTLLLRQLMILVNVKGDDLQVELSNLVRVLRHVDRESRVGFLTRPVAEQVVWVAVVHSYDQFLRDFENVCIHSLKFDFGSSSDSKSQDQRRYIRGLSAASAADLSREVPTAESESLALVRSGRHLVRERKSPGVGLVAWRILLESRPTTQQPGLQIRSAAARVACATWQAGRPGLCGLLMQPEVVSNAWCLNDLARALAKSGSELSPALGLLDAASQLGAPPDVQRVVEENRCKVTHHRSHYEVLRPVGCPVAHESTPSTTPS